MGSQMKYDVCVVGAGVAGATMAAYLGRQGKSVAVVEQSWSEPDEIIGELLQPDGVRRLQQMGFEDAFEGYEAQQVRGYAMFMNGESICIPYPEDGIGYGFRYGRFIQKLRSYLPELPTVDRLQGRVTDLIVADNGSVDGVTYTTADGEDKTAHAHLTILCQGSSSRLRKGLSNADLKVKGHMMGFILEGVEAPFPGHGHVIIADPAPVLVYPVGPNKLRVLIDFPKSVRVSKKTELDSYLVNKIAPQLPQIIREAFVAEVRLGNFKNKPTCLLAAKPKLRSNVVLLGDSLNQRHPTTGGGMTVALTDVQALAKVLVPADISDPAAVRSAIKSFYKNRYTDNATINILAYALYRVFRHPQLGRACFNYLKRGGKFATEPMAILAGLSRNRFTLVKHFFQVALRAIKDALKPFPTPAKIAVSYRLLRDAITIITPLLADEIPSIENDSTERQKEENRCLINTLR